jgi:hypothetical protein
MLLATSLLLGSETVAQQNQLTPEQQELIQGVAGDEDFEMLPSIDTIDPILVSKYLIFTNDWLNLPVTRQQFKKWTDTLDRVYECYEEFMSGRVWGNGAIVVGYRPDGATAHGGRVVLVYVARDDERFSPDEIRRGGPTKTMLHEMGHLFSWANSSAPECRWMGEDETGAEFLVAYYYEKSGLSTVGDNHRYSHIERAINNLLSGKIKDFGYHEGTAYDLYMFGLVDRVGWDTMKKTVQSYAPGKNTYTPTKVYDNTGGREGHAIAHQFFDRVAFFHDQARELAKTDPKVLNGIPPSGRNLIGEQVLRSLPDKGKYLDEYFTVETDPPTTRTVITVPTPSPTPPTPSSKTVVQQPIPPRQSSPPSEKDIFDAATSGILRDVESLVAKDADLVRAQTSSGYTPLHYAAMNNARTDVVEFLLAHGADINAKDKDGNTPLHCAALLNRSVELNVLSYLIAKGADVKAKNSAGKTPLDVAPPRKSVGLSARREKSERKPLKSSLRSLRSLRLSIYRKVRRERKEKDSFYPFTVYSET